MAQTLTNELRGKIIKASMAHAFERREEKWYAQSVDLAEAIYQHRFHRDLPFVSSLSEDWYTQIDSIAFKHEAYSQYQAKGFERFAHYDEPFGDFKLKRLHRFPQYFDHVRIDKDHPQYKVLADHADVWQAIRDAEIALQDELRTLLHSVRTVEKLLEQWPEGEQFIPKADKPAKQTAVVPHDLTAKINRMLGIAEV